MYRIEKVGEHHFYIKAIGTFPPSVAENFIKDFEEKLKGVRNFSVIVDGLDVILLNLKSFEIILEFLRKNNEKLIRSAYIISKNPPLKKEFQILLDRAESPKRKIVKNLEKAKKWIGVSKVIIEKD
ncbi:MAG: hypothetical protein ACFFB0_20660 [Promethearchaeota archaeon]